MYVYVCISDWELQTKPDEFVQHDSRLLNIVWEAVWNFPIGAVQDGFLQEQGREAG